LIERVRLHQQCCPREISICNPDAVVGGKEAIHAAIQNWRLGQLPALGCPAASLSAPPPRSRKICPRREQLPPLAEQLRPAIGALDLAADQMGKTHFGNFAREAGLLGSPVAKCRMRRLTVPSKLINTGLPRISAQAGQPRCAPW